MESKNFGKQTVKRYMYKINADLYHENLIVNSNCLCGHHNENAGHYMLHCNRFTLSRIIMLFEINKLNIMVVNM
jgi:hypothetical protein